MAGKTPNFGDNLSVLSVDLVKELVAFHAEGTLIEAGQDTLRRGMQQLEDVGRRNHLSSLRLPEPLRFVVVPVQTDLYVEAWQRSGRLRSHNWVALEEEEALRHHVMWTHDNPLKRHPVFVGNLQEIDYEDALKNRWVYNNSSKRVRASLRRGVDLLIRTTTEIEKIYIPS